MPKPDENETDEPSSERTRRVKPEHATLVAIVTSLIATITSGGGVYSFREVSTKMEQLNVSVIELRAEVKSNGADKVRFAAELQELRGQIRELERGQSTILATQSALVAKMENMARERKNQ